MKQSKVMQIMQAAWDGNMFNSYLRLNNGMRGILSNLIELNLLFEEDDFKHIMKCFDAGYWLGVSLNGNHIGESTYFDACTMNKSAAISYEKHFKRQPFILKNHRLYEGFELKYKDLFWIVTGWTKDNKSITLVGYKNLRGEGKRKQMKLNRKEFLQIKKEMELI